MTLTTWLKIPFFYFVFKAVSNVSVQVKIIITIIIITNSKYRTTPTIIKKAILFLKGFTESKDS